METDRRLVDFFGTTVQLTCAPRDIEDVDFFFGPHLLAVDSVPSDYVVELFGAEGFLRSLLDKDQREKTFRIQTGAGALVEEHTFTRWSAVPSPLPPFRLMRDQVGVVQATVLARGERCVALHGEPHNGKTSIGLHLAARGWALVSDQLLVLHRQTGLVCPYLAPVGLRGRTLTELRGAGALDDVVQRRSWSEVSGEVVLTRPERLARVVPAHRRLRPPVHLVRVRRGSGTVCLEPTEQPPRAWPAGAWAWLRTALTGGLPMTVINLPHRGGERAAADLLEGCFDA